MTEGASGIPVACLPVIFHGATGKLVILGTALVIGRLINQVDDVADFIVSLRLQYFHVRRVSQFVRKLLHQICKRNTKFLCLLVLIRRRTGATEELDFLEAYFTSVKRDIFRWGRNDRREAPDLLTGSAVSTFGACMLRLQRPAIARRPRPGSRICSRRISCPDTSRNNSESEIDTVFAALNAHRLGVLLMANNPLFTRRERIIALAVCYAVPTMYVQREFANSGGLMSYGTDPPDVYRLAGGYAGRILKGDEPADLPVIQPTKFELVINLKDREGDQTGYPADTARPRRRGDRMSDPACPLRVIRYRCAWCPAWHDVRSTPKANMRLQRNI